jgi:hypothetical protein
VRLTAPEFRMMGTRGSLNRQNVKYVRNLKGEWRRPLGLRWHRLVRAYVLNNPADFVALG